MSFMIPDDDKKEAPAEPTPVAPESEEEAKPKEAA